MPSTFIPKLLYLLLLLFCFCFVLFCFFLGSHLWHMEVPGLGVESEPQPQQHKVQATFVTYSASCSNTGSLTQWKRWGVKPISSWTLCCVLNPLSHNGNSCYYCYFNYFFSWGKINSVYISKGLSRSLIFSFLAVIHMKCIQFWTI